MHSIIWSVKLHSSHTGLCWQTSCVCIKSYPSIQTYGNGIQKNRLIETKLWICSLIVFCFIFGKSNPDQLVQSWSGFDLPIIKTEDNQWAYSKFSLNLGCQDMDKDWISRVKLCASYLMCYQHATVVSVWMGFIFWNNEWLEIRMSLTFHWALLCGGIFRIGNTNRAWRRRHLLAH